MRGFTAVEKIIILVLLDLFVKFPFFLVLKSKNVTTLKLCLILIIIVRSVVSQSLLKPFLWLDNMQRKVFFAHSKPGAAVCCSSRQVGK